jgi:hypothetical protein
MTVGVLVKIRSKYLRNKNRRQTNSKGIWCTRGRMSQLFALTAFSWRDFDAVDDAMAGNRLWQSRVTKAEHAHAQRHAPPLPRTVDSSNTGLPGGRAQRHVRAMYTYTRTQTHTDRQTYTHRGTRKQRRAHTRTEASARTRTHRDTRTQRRARARTQRRASAQRHTHTYTRARTHTHRGTRTRAETHIRARARTHTHTLRAPPFFTLALLRFGTLSIARYSKVSRTLSVSVISCKERPHLAYFAKGKNH